MISLFWNQCFKSFCALSVAHYFFWIGVIVDARCQVYVLENRHVAWPESRRQRKPIFVKEIPEIKMRDDYLEVVLCWALYPLLYLQTWGHLLIDESLHTGRHSERQLEQPQCFKPGLMGHVWIQQQGIASSSCPHICWINKEILPKKHSVHWQMITVVGKDMCIWMRVITHHRESVHTLVSFLQEGEEILSVVEGLLWLCLIPPPLSAAEFPDWFTCLEASMDAAFRAFFLARNKQKKRWISSWMWQFCITSKVQTGITLITSWSRVWKKSKAIIHAA